MSTSSGCPGCAVVLQRHGHRRAVRDHRRRRRRRRRWQRRARLLDEHEVEGVDVLVAAGWRRGVPRARRRRCAPRAPPRRSPGRSLRSPRPDRHHSANPMIGGTLKRRPPPRGRRRDLVAIERVRHLVVTQHVGQREWLGHRFDVVEFELVDVGEVVDDVAEAPSPGRAPPRSAPAGEAERPWPPRRRKCGRTRGRIGVDGPGLRSHGSAWRGGPSDASVFGATSDLVEQPDEGSRLPGASRLVVVAASGVRRRPGRWWWAAAAAEVTPSRWIAHTV